MPGLVGDEEMMDVRHDELSSEQQAESSSSVAFRVLAVDSRGNLVATRLPLRATPVSNGEKYKMASVAIVNEEPAILYKARGVGLAKGDLAVQRVASGSMFGRERVTAFARKDGSIDLIDTSRNAEHLLTLRNKDMKKGMHRWIGLAVANDGIFACTSAGDMRFFPVTRTHDEAGSSDGGTTASRLESDDAKSLRRDLPEPLQHVVFEPASDPNVFAYGGEEIPLSVWDARQAFAPAQEPHSPVSDKTNGNHAVPERNGDETAMSNKQMKRKRAAENRARAAELLWGETWRARSLPNDALSLPQRAGILCLLPLSKERWAVGTKSGHVRIYDTSRQRKHTHDIRIFDAPIKHLTASFAGTELVASDTNGRIFVVDARSGATLYQYKGITGAMSALQTLPPPLLKGKSARSQTSYLLSASADRMIRLHSVPLPSEAEASDDKRKTTRRKGEVVVSAFVRDGISALAWDGILPEDDEVEEVQVTQRRQTHTANGSEDSGEEEDDHDEVWDEMTTVEQKRSGTRHAHEDAAEEGDDVVAKEGRSKRRK